VAGRAVFGLCLAGGEGVDKMRNFVGTVIGSVLFAAIITLCAILPPFVCWFFKLGAFSR